MGAHERELPRLCALGSSTVGVSCLQLEAKHSLQPGKFRLSQHESRAVLVGSPHCGSVGLPQVETMGHVTKKTIPDTKSHRGLQPYHPEPA